MEEEKKKTETYSRGHRQGRIIGGSVLILLGLIFLLENYGLWNIEFSKLWPLILIVIGVGILFKRS